MASRRIFRFNDSNCWYLLIISRIVVGFFVEPTTSFLLVPSTFQRIVVSNHAIIRFASTVPNLNDDDIATSSPLVIDEVTVDRRPYEQRTKGPRSARRMNHGFRYLYRNSSHLYENVTALEYLTNFYPETEVMEMNRTFPPLLDLNVSRHIHPKMRFLQETLMYDDQCNSAGESLVLNVSELEIPAQYFGARLEKTIAPNHAFLAYMGLPRGLSLLVKNEDEDEKRNHRRRDRTINRFHEFLVSCRRSKQFCAMCNKWQREKQMQLDHPFSHQQQITSKQIEAFQFIFGRGLLAAARGDMVQANNTWPLEHINITSKDVIELLIQHGANPLEKDTRGSTVLHWAAGAGNLEAFQTLLPYFPNKFLEKTERDGATPLHWACAGADNNEFGTGGNYHLCQYILSECENEMEISAKELVNEQTKDGNSPLMWAAWSSSLDVVKLMVRYRARWDQSNRNGCTVAHWAASGGNLEVCKYLAEVVGVDFFVANFGGNTPLTHAVAFGRLDVVHWLRELAATLEDDRDDLIAKQLAADFATWGDEQLREDKEQRKNILKLFDDDYWEN